jgi:hypothetical protein
MEASNLNIANFEDFRLINFYNSSQNQDKIPTIDLTSTLDTTENQFEVIEIFDEFSKSGVITTDHFIIEEILEDDKNFNKIEENLSEFLKIDNKKKIPNFPCLLCNLNFKSKFNLENHFSSLRHQKTENEFIESEQNVDEKLSVDEMIIEDTEDDFDLIKYEIFPCRECETTFDRFTDLKNHMKAQHSYFKCQICSRRYKNQKDFQEHFKRHEKSKGYICGLCGKIFTNNQNLRRHEKAHNGVKKFSCKICAHKFDQKSNYLRHLKIHSDVYEVRYSGPSKVIL